jgi:tetratricopeptide (TPR) repeat protein
VQQLLYYAITCGRYRNAAEMYAKVLALKPQEWRAQLNRGVSLLGAGDYEEARKAFREAFKMTNRVELYDAINHLKQMQKRPKGLTLAIASAEQSATGQHDSIAGEILGGGNELSCIHIFCHCPLYIPVMPATIFKCVRPSLLHVLSSFLQVAFLKKAQLKFQRANVRSGCTKGFLRFLS